MSGAAKGREGEGEGREGRGGREERRREGRIAKGRGEKGGLLNSYCSVCEERSRIESFDFQFFENLE